MEDFKEQVKKSFHACKGDIDALRVENSSLKDKLFILEQENRNLKSELREMNSSMTDMKAELKGLNIAINFIKEFNEKQQAVMGHQQQTLQPQVQPEIDNVAQNNQIRSEQTLYQQPTQTTPSQHINFPKQKPIQSEDPYEALLAFKARSNKREILKQKMVSMVGEGGMNLSELKFMFVDHFKYCSKATFYNYLKELELERYVKVERENSKNHIYLMNSNSLNRQI